MTLISRTHLLAAGCCIFLLWGGARASSEDDDAHDDEVQARAKHQVEMLMNEGLPFAEKMLRENGEFFPFGAVRVRGGPIRIVGTASGEQPAAENVLEQLLADLRLGAQSREYDASAVFVNVEIPRPGDGQVVSAVFVGLEHVDGYCADVFFPYTRDENGLVLGESFAAARDGTIFGSCR